MTMIYLLLCSGITVTHTIASIHPKRSLLPAVPVADILEPCDYVTGKKKSVILQKKRQVENSC